MRLQVQAWVLRAKARAALRVQDTDAALQCARAAQVLCATEQGRLLEGLAEMAREG